MGIQTAGRQCPGAASGALQSAKVPSWYRRGAGSSGSALGSVAPATIDGCWPRGRQVYDGSISGHQNSMFKAIAPRVALIYTSCINVRIGREINAICKPTHLTSLGAASKSRVPIGCTYLLCSWPGALLPRLNLQLSIGGSLHTYSFLLPINQATLQHPSPVESQLLSHGTPKCWV